MEQTKFSAHGMTVSTSTEQWYTWYGSVCQTEWQPGEILGFSKCLIKLTPKGKVFSFFPVTNPCQTECAVVQHTSAWFDDRVHLLSCTVRE